MADYYVNAVSGDDNHNGTSVALAFKTIHQALCHVAPGDNVYIKDTGPYTAAARHSAIPVFTGGSWNPTTRRVIKAGQFVDYSYQSGDRIWLASASIGNGGWYPVAAVIDDDTLLLADDSLYPGGPLSDIHNDCTTAMAALFVAGSADDWIRIKGYGSSVEDDGIVTLDGSNVFEHGFVGLSGNSYYRIENIAVRNTLNTCWQWASGDYVSFRRCAAVNSNGHNGWRGRDRCTWRDCTAEHHGTGILGVNYNQVVGCAISACASVGISLTMFSGAVGCTVHYCSTGISLFSHATVAWCTLYHCAAFAIRHVTSTGSHFSILNCTIDGGGLADSVGVQSNSMASAVVNCILHNCATCLKAPTTFGDLLVSRHNMYNPSSGGTAVEGFALGEGSVVGIDPRFLDEAGHDYRLRWDSPARAAGWPAYLDMGAQQRKENSRGRGILTGGEM